MTDTNWAACPFCESTDVEVTDVTRTRPGIVLVDNACNDCFTTWTNKHLANHRYDISTPQWAIDAANADGTDIEDIEHLVTWSMAIDAANAKDAVRQVLGIIADPGNQATVWVIESSEAKTVIDAEDPNNLEILRIEEPT